MMLVGNIQIVENPESCALSTLIRFGGINHVNGALRHTLYSSSSLSSVFRFAIPDRKSSLFRMGRTVDVNKLIRKMVEGTSEIMNHISCQQPDFGRRTMDIEHAINVMSSGRVVFTFDSIRVGLDESIPHDL